MAIDLERVLLRFVVDQDVVVVYDAELHCRDSRRARCREVRSTRPSLAQRALPEAGLAHQTVRRGVGTVSRDPGGLGRRGGEAESDERELHERSVGHRVVLWAVIRVFLCRKQAPSSLPKSLSSRAGGGAQT